MKTGIAAYQAQLNQAVQPVSKSAEVNSRASEDVDRAQFLAMFDKLDDYGRRVALAQMSALVRVQRGA